MNEFIAVAKSPFSNAAIPEFIWVQLQGLLADAEIPPGISKRPNKTRQRFDITNPRSDALVE
jgi:hypothetical protein